MCRVLAVSVSSFYEWAQRPESHHTQENRQLCEEIQRIHKKKYQTYGSPRMTAELRKNGYKCSRPRVARLMQSLGIQAKTARKFKVTTDSNHQEPIAPNLLDQEFHVDQPNEVWTSDLTYIKTSCRLAISDGDPGAVQSRNYWLLTQSSADDRKHRERCLGYGCTASSATCRSESPL